MTVDLDSYLFSLLISAVVINLGLSLYGVLRKPSLIKKIIALTIFGDTANVLAIIVGYRAWPSPYTPPTPPILLNRHPTTSDIVSFAANSVDPLPQALVLTAVVIGLAVTVFLVFLTLQIYRHYGTVDVRKVRRLRG